MQRKKFLTLVLDKELYHLKSFITTFTISVFVFNSNAYENVGAKKIFITGIIKKAADYLDK